MNRRWPWAKQPTTFDRAADSGALFALIAAALWALQARFARRAALRGLLNATIAWVASTFVSRRHRAQATAAAFATGAVLESGLAGVPTAAVAMGTLKDGDASDVAAAALGAGVALASTKVWPVPPSEGPDAPKESLPARAQPSPDGDGLAIVVNADSGTNGDTPTEELKDAFPQAKIDEVQIVEGDELRKALDIAATHSMVVGISGGDGSVNTAAQVALEQGKPLAVFPSGTLNHLTGALGIEFIDDTVEAVKEGEAVCMDVATIDNHVFVNTASFGAYVELVDMREKLEKQIGKWPAVVIALVRVLRKSKPLCVEIDGREMKVWMAFLGNCRYSPSGFAPSWRRSLSDGAIDLRYVDGSAPWARLRLVAAVLTGRLGRSKVYKQTVLEEVRIRSLEGPLRLARDGETFEASSEEVIVRKLPDKLTVYCPHDNVA